MVIALLGGLASIVMLVFAVVLFADELGLVVLLEIEMRNKSNGNNVIDKMINKVLKGAGIDEK